MNAKNLFKNWNLIRILRLTLGVSAVFVSLEPGMLIWLPVSLYFIWTALFTRSCYNNMCEPNKNEQIND